MNIVVSHRSDLSGNTLPAACAQFFIRFWLCGEIVRKNVTKNGASAAICGLSERKTAEELEMLVMRSNSPLPAPLMLSRKTLMSMRSMPMEGSRII